ncbi:MAG: cadherin repeat domain-containing protein [Flavobacteriales bacterium]|nr:cadherin repeat domain-containing protein [Bacteroidota bacterium]MCB9240624.1 cadherin repeat domain-containing protein [Flavobacteriales bacterium]
MKHLVSGILILMAAAASAQRPNQLCSRSQFNFGTEFRPVKASETLYFQAFEAGSGWQLYQISEEGFSRISQFSSEYGSKKNLETACGGGMINRMVNFNNTVVFHVSGKGQKNGIYRVEDGRVVKIVSGIDQCSPMVEHNGILHVEGYGTTSSGSRWKRAIKINTSWSVERSREISHTYSIATEAAPLGGSIYGTVSGQIAIWSETGFVPGHHELHNVQGLFTFQNRLYFHANRAGAGMRQYSIGAEGDIHEHGAIYPGMNMINVHPPLVLEDKVYFVADPDQKGLRLYQLDHEEVHELVILAAKSGYRDFQGMDVYKDQLFMSVSGVKGPIYDLYQYDGRTFTERNPDYVQNVRGVAVLNGELIYLATELGGEALYRSTPVLPPAVEDDTFSIYDFWYNGDLVGKVQASDPSGRIRYHIVSGDEKGVFEVDYFNGELRVADFNGIRHHANKGYDLVVKCENRSGAFSEANVHVTIKKGQKMDLQNLHETLMFFPDFSKKSTLTTRTLPEGQKVMVFDADFNMVDELTVKNRAIVIGKYRPGIYLLNVKNERNLYQKIELN